MHSKILVSYGTMLMTIKLVTVRFGGMLGLEL